MGIEIIIGLWMQRLRCMQVFLTVCQEGLEAVTTQWQWAYPASKSWFLNTTLHEKEPHFPGEAADPGLRREKYKMNWRIL